MTLRLGQTTSDQRSEAAHRVNRDEPSHSSREQVSPDPESVSKHIQVRTGLDRLARFKAGSSATIALPGTECPLDPPPHPVLPGTEEFPPSLLTPEPPPDPVLLILAIVSMFLAVSLHFSKEYCIPKPSDMGWTLKSDARAHHDHLALVVLFKTLQNHAVDINARSQRLSSTTSLSILRKG
ncbi:uncharacterized protein LOC121249298 [Juglans microcarpa x Juglans regia]|uniref:uncharacterized protein LOC121249298 n=1 Tax=Juglans microcarpa x Juglans regia TaxID=2249226 RepID=UPI001B7F6E80|nr:uncharacterized protein LOC121249298 [Juglans microcarpa x Juglans regia]